MKYLPLLIFAFSCSPQSLNDFIIGEERVLEQLIYDESGFQVGQSQRSEEQSPVRPARPAVRLNIINF